MNSDLYILYEVYKNVAELDKEYYILIFSCIDLYTWCCLECFNCAFNIKKKSATIDQECICTNVVNDFKAKV